LTGEIISISTGYRSSPQYEYQYIYKGKKYTDNASTNVKKLNLFIGKTFPVLFSPKTKNSELLISPEDFEKFRIIFPDSLLWILKYKK